MSSAVAAFSSITRNHFRHGIRTHAARNVASIFTATAYMAPTPVFAGIGKSSRNKSSLSMADDKKPFNTWTFDEACQTMEFNRISASSMTLTDDISVIDDSDLVVVGIYGPPKKDDDEDEEEKKNDKDEEVPEPILSGKAKQLDEELGGALTEAMMENYKAFKHGGAADATTPTLRIVSSGSKVSTDKNMRSCPWTAKSIVDSRQIDSRCY